jgi:hypothetical protein
VSHQQYFPWNCKIRLQTSRSGEIKSYLGISLWDGCNQIIMPCTTVCVCVCVCVCIRQRHHSYVHERETHTVTDSDREGDTFTHIHTFFHSLSLSLSLYLSISPSLSSRSCSIFLDLSSVTEKWKELCRMPDHCDVITPPIDILQERETHRIFQKRHTHLFSSAI